MSLSALVGSTLIGAALALLITLTLHGRFSIRRLAELNYPTAREYRKERLRG